MTLLRVENLSKTYHIHHLERRLPAFQHLSFSLDAGQFSLVSGPNGAGKSTLLRCLYRSALPSAGQARYQSRHGEIDLARANDIDVRLLRRGELRYVTQFLRPRPRTSALDIVTEGAPDLPRHEAVQAAAELLGELGLRRELWGAYPSTFSGGEQQKVNLARALVRPPRLLLLDEPSASLDPAARAALARRLGELRSQGVALLGIFHHPGDVAGLIDGEVKIAAPAGAMREEAAYGD